MSRHNWRTGNGFRTAMPVPGLYPDTVRKYQSEPADQRRRTRLPEPVLVWWLTDLATLLEAGIPLSQALRIVGRAKKTYDFSVEVNRRIHRGQSLSMALSGCGPEIVPEIVHAGEKSGRLPEALRNAAGFLTARQQAMRVLRRELGMSFTTAIFAFLALVFVVWFVIPRFATLYARIRVPLPHVMRVAIRVNALVSDNWPVLLILALLVWIPIRWWIGRLEVVRRSHLAVFYLALGTLLRSGISIVHALGIAGTASGFPSIRSGAEYAVREVLRGADLTETMYRAALLPPELVPSFASGAASGRLAESLESMSRLLQQQVRDTIERAAKQLAVLAVIVLGALVLILWISVYLPIVHLAVSTLRKILALRRGG